jgi:hypothetical protein
MNFTYAYVAVIEHGKPIAASNTWEGLKELVDDYMGANDGEFHAYNSKYPDDYRGYWEYKTMNPATKNLENECIKAYLVDYQQRKATTPESLNTESYIGEKL